MITYDGLSVNKLFVLMDDYNVEQECEYSRGFMYSLGEPIMNK